MANRGVWKEANALGAGLIVGAGMGSRPKKEKSPINRSPKVHSPDALALQEMPHVEYDGYEPLDFEVEKLPVSPEEKRQLMLAFRGSGVLVQDEAGKWLVCSLDDTRPATQEEMMKLPRITTKKLEARKAVLESFRSLQTETERSSPRHRRTPRG